MHVWMAGELVLGVHVKSALNFSTKGQATHDMISFWSWLKSVDFFLSTNAPKNRRGCCLVLFSFFLDFSHRLSCYLPCPVLCSSNNQDWFRTTEGSFWRASYICGQRWCYHSASAAHIAMVSSSTSSVVVCPDDARGHRPTAVPCSLSPPSSHGWSRIS